MYSNYKITETTKERETFGRKKVHENNGAGKGKKYYLLSPTTVIKFTDVCTVACVVDETQPPEEKIKFSFRSNQNPD